MLFRSPAEDRRHSLSQLTALLAIPELSGEGTKDYLLAQFYSYRSLLLFRLLPDIPLPYRLGIYFLRLILTSFTLINIHFSDRPSRDRYLKLAKKDGQDVLEAESQFSQKERRLFKTYERKFLRILLSLGFYRSASPGRSMGQASTMPALCHTPQNRSPPPATLPASFTKRSMSTSPMAPPGNSCRRRA